MTNVIEFTNAERKKLRRQYEKEGYTLVELADTWGVGIQVIKRELIAAGATIRPRGRRPQS